MLDNDLAVLFPWARRIALENSLFTRLDGMATAIQSDTVTNRNLELGSFVVRLSHASLFLKAGAYTESLVETLESLPNAFEVALGKVRTASSRQAVEDTRDRVEPIRISLLERFPLAPVQNSMLNVLKVVDTFEKQERAKRSLFSSFTIDNFQDTIADFVLKEADVIAPDMESIQAFIGRVEQLCAESRPPELLDQIFEATAEIEALALLSDMTTTAGVSR